MKAPITIPVLFAGALLAGCASSPALDAYAPARLPLEIKPENITLTANNWKDAGTDTPEHTLETLMWAENANNDAREKEVTLLRTGYWKGYFGTTPVSVEPLPKEIPAMVQPEEGPAMLGFDIPMLNQSPSGVRKDVLDNQIMRADQGTENWLLKPYIKGPLSDREIGTPDHPAPINFNILSRDLLPTQAEINQIPQQYQHLTAEWLDIIILDRKEVSPTEVELDVREGRSWSSDPGVAAYFYRPYDFQLEGTSWKFIRQTDYLVNDKELPDFFVPRSTAKSP